MKFDELTDEQKEKFSKCKTSEELLKQAREEGFELSEEELEDISGGLEWTSSCNDLTAV